MARNYRQEEEQHKTPKYLAENAARKKARRMLEKEGLVHKGDGKEVDHKNLRPTDDSRKNLQVLSKHANRAKQPPTKTQRKK